MGARLDPAKYAGQAKVMPMPFAMRLLDTKECFVIHHPLVANYQGIFVLSAKS
jgi:hypothetical protein